MRIFVVHFMHFVHFHTQCAGYEHLTQRPQSAILAQSAQSAHSAYPFFCFSHHILFAALSRNR